MYYVYVDLRSEDGSKIADIPSGDISSGGIN
jgi:hypothetical protein